MKKLFKYPLTAILIVVLLIGMPVTISYLYKEKHKASYAGVDTLARPSVTPENTPEALPSVSHEASPSVTTAPVIPSASIQDSDPDEGMETEITPPHNKPSNSYKFTTVGNEYFDDALFIGDSRTVGLSEYAPFSGATYFANIGMSAHSAMTTQVSLPSVGKLTLTQLLQSKSFGKVYIMLGINELGYMFNTIIDKYTALLNTVKELQPDAIIYIEANMHVTKSKSDKDNIINNKAIDNLNNSLKQLADGDKIFYIDVNEKFDDESGNLDSCYTSDNAHILGKYYKEWGEWICTKAVQR